MILNKASQGPYITISIKELDMIIMYTSYIIQNKKILFSICGGPIHTSIGPDSIIYEEILEIFRSK